MNNLRVEIEKTWQSIHSHLGHRSLPLARGIPLPAHPHKHKSLIISEGEFLKTKTSSIDPFEADYS